MTVSTSIEDVRVSTASATPRASIVVPTYERAASVERLVRQLAAQTVARDIEVIVVDDGSRRDPTRRLRALDVPFSLFVERQANAGAAAARHRGVTLSRAPVVLFLDDDMQVGATVVEAHLELHERDDRAVVLGRILPDPALESALFERFHAQMLATFAAAVLAGKKPLRGQNVYTGNLSMRRAAYLAVGGFDASFGHSEDAELGVRLEKAGARFYLSDDASSVHSSDRESLEAFRRRAKAYGAFDSRIGKKHRDVPHASPWRYFHELPVASRPLLLFSLVAPGTGERLAGAALRLSGWLDRAGLEASALRGTTLAFGLEYARGMREEAGDLASALDSWIDYADRAGARGRLARALVAARRMRAAVAADYETLRANDAKYGSRPGAPVLRAGFQVMLAVRLMHFFRDLGAPLGARVASRAIRHLFGSDVHWDARIEPGVSIVHGMGLAISSKASVAGGCVLFQNVTLGESLGGAPALGRDVHVGPGATLLGPITVGDRSKVMASCVVRDDVPPGSLVAAPAPQVCPRKARR
jgi:serine acetyltransferase/GT2 family glycosyltransferase